MFQVFESNFKYSTLFILGKIGSVLHFLLEENVCNTEQGLARLVLSSL